MAKRLTGSGCLLRCCGGRSRYGYIRLGGDRPKGSAVLGANLGHLRMVGRRRDAAPYAENPRR